MKNKFNIRYTSLGIIFLALIAFTGCNDSFLDLAPKGNATEQNAFKSYDNFKAYSWLLYKGLPKYDDSNYNNDINAGYLFDNSDDHNNWATQNITPQNSGGDWKFDYIRSVNIMLSHIDASQMKDAEKKHWRSVGYFFRAYRYVQMMMEFGDVNWVDHVVTLDDTKTLYGTRTPRKELAQHIFDDLTYAVNNIGDFKDTDLKQSINKDCVMALFSRFGLYEGTWMKYHDAHPDATLIKQYLDASVKYSLELMQKYPQLNSNWGELFTSESLSSTPGIILYREYAQGKAMHSLARMARTSSAYAEMTQQTMDGYLCTNGSQVYVIDPTTTKGRNAVFEQFKHRDKRLWYTVCPPYKVSASGGSASKWDTLAVGKYATDGARLVETKQDSIMFVENINIFNKDYAGQTGKKLPVSNWAGYYVAEMPHFYDNNMTQAFLASRCGYLCWMYYDEHTTPTLLGQNTTDCPIFRVGEAILNYAEAYFELNTTLDQNAIEGLTKLRKRAGLPDFTPSQYTSTFDPNRDSDVDPVLWEIRRERRNELMAQGFGFIDIRRWNKGGDYLNVKPVGCWVSNADYANKLKIDGGAAEGYVEYYTQPKGWPSDGSYYLNPLPLPELALNRHLKQNPGYPTR